MIDKEIFSQQMAVLADRIGRPLLGETLREYRRVLSAALTTEQFLAATTIAFTAWSAEFRNWPSPQQLVELITPVPVPTLGALEAFERVLAITNDPRISISEQRLAVQALGAAAVRAFYAVGGLRDFRNVLEDDVVWLRKRFVPAYEAACEHADAEREATLALRSADERVRLLTTQVAVALTLPRPRKEIASAPVLAGVEKP